jgi:hypothetical protein
MLTEEFNPFNFQVIIEREKITFAILKLLLVYIIVLYFLFSSLAILLCVSLILLW